MPLLGTFMCIGLNKENENAISFEIEEKQSKLSTKNREKAHTS